VVVYQCPLHSCGRSIYFSSFLLPALLQHDVSPGCVSLGLLQGLKLEEPSQLQRTRLRFWASAQRNQFSTLAAT